MLLALGLNLVIGYVGLLDLGFMAFYAIGAYTAAILAIHKVPFIFCVLTAILRLDARSCCRRIPSASAPW